MPTTKKPTRPYVGQRVAPGVYVSALYYSHKSQAGALVTEATLTLSDGTTRTVPVV